MRSFAVVSVLAAIPVVLGQLQINTPTSLTFCQPVQLTWQDGTPPYFVAVIPGGDTSGTPLEQFPQQSGTSLTWIVDIKAGTAVTLKLTDSTGLQAFSGQATIQAGTVSTCTTSSSTATSTSSTKSSTGSHSTTITKTSTKSTTSTKTSSTATTVTSTSTATTVSSLTTTSNSLTSLSSSSTANSTSTSATSSAAPTKTGAASHVAPAAVLSLAGLLGFVGAVIV